MGDAFSLEQRLQLGESAALQEKLEITLLNLVLPLLLLVGSGRKVTILRQRLDKLCYVRTFRSCGGQMSSTSSISSSELSRVVSTQRSTAITITPQPQTADRVTTLQTASRLDFSVRQTISSHVFPLYALCSRPPNTPHLLRGQSDEGVAEYCRHHTVFYQLSFFILDYICPYVHIIRKYGTECGEWSVALWRLLDYIDLYRTPLYIMLLRCSVSRFISLTHIYISFIRGRERLSPEPGPGEVSLNKSLLAASLNCELEELRQEILKKRRGE